MKHARTKATAISREVKEKVFDRDDGCCIICGQLGFPDSHYIKRSQGGMGIEENIGCMCHRCHDLYDSSPLRKYMRKRFADHLMRHYPGWNEEDLIYQKYPKELRV